MTDFEWLDSGPNGSEGHYSMHSKNPHFATPLYTTRAFEGARLLNCFECASD